MASFIISDVVPIMGITISTFQLSSPYHVICDCRRQRDLGSLNPIPLAVSWLNCLSWIIYSSVIGDFYLFLSVFAGMFISSFALITAIQLLGVHGRYKAGITMEKVLSVGLTLWVLLCGVLVVTKDLVLVKQIIGGFVIGSSLSYYASPFSSLLTVVRTGDASSLYLPTIALNVSGTLLWSMYGIFIADYYLLFASGLGFLFSAMQVGIKVYFHLFNAGKLNYSPTEADIAIGTGIGLNSLGDSSRLGSGLDGVGGFNNTGNYDEEGTVRNQQPSVVLNDTPSLTEGIGVGPVQVCVHQHQHQHLHSHHNQFQQQQHQQQPFQQQHQQESRYRSDGDEVRSGLLGGHIPDSAYAGIGSAGGSDDVVGRGASTSEGVMAGGEWQPRQRAPSILDTVAALLAPMEPFLDEDAVVKDESAAYNNEGVDMDAIEGREQRSTSIWGAGTGAPAEGVTSEYTAVLDTGVGGSAGYQPLPVVLAPESATVVDLTATGVMFGAANAVNEITSSLNPNPNPGTVHFEAHSEPQDVHDGTLPLMVAPMYLSDLPVGGSTLTSRALARSDITTGSE